MQLDRLGGTAYRLRTLTVDIEGGPLVPRSVLNALRLSTRTTLCKGSELWETSDMNMPVILPVPAMQVEPGQSIAVSLRYVPGGGYERLTVATLRA